MPFTPMIVAGLLAGLLLVAAAHADPGAPPNLSLQPPSVIPTPPNVIPMPPIATPMHPNIILPPRRCRIFYRTDSFGFVRRVRRCRR